MNNRTHLSISRNFILAAIVSTQAFGGMTAHAESPSEMEDMRREVRQLRQQVQLLRAAISEAADFDYQKAAALSRALKAVPPAPEPVATKPREEAAEKPAAPAPVAAPTPVASAPAAASTSKSGRRSSEANKRSQEAPQALGTVHGKVSVPKGEPIAYVYVENVSAPPVKEQRVIQQVGKKFVPAWAVVQRGTSISFPNKDNIYHNVFSLSSGNSFDLGLYNSAGEAKSYTFNEAGEVEIYCNIHPQMAASTLVVPNRLYAKVKPDGTFEIAGVPVGKRKIVGWAPGSRLTATWVEVDAGDAAQVEIKLEPKASGHTNKSGQQYGSY